MKRYLIIGLAMCAINGVHATPAASVRADVADARNASAGPAKRPQQSAPPRRLSEQELAELRRQLQQFNQQYTRRP